ncbi:NTF2-like protein [Marasmius fiardii PR-910]|nr:NTF2-like protein [Marasmius fiardii PR-910]
MTTPAPSTGSAPSAALTRDDIAIATRAADSFIKLYYTAYDSSTRLTDLPNFYRSTSSITWNGNPLQGSDGVKQLIEKMPPTKHEMLSFDCHPIPGSTPPSLLVNVSGSVIHGRQHPPPANQGRGNTRSVDGLSRIFSQIFMLVPDPNVPPNPGEGTKYYVSVDALRFVG